VQDDGFLFIGKIVGVHGLGGNLRVNSYAESPSIYKPNSRIFLKRKDNQKHSYAIEWAKPHRRNLLLSLKGVTTRELAQVLVGAKIFIAKSSLPQLEAGEYYWFDIIGLSVYTLEDEYLGQIETVIPTDGNDVFVVKKGGRETLIPALASVVAQVDVPGKIMRVKLPEGL
jgi:16S rRNA processing protein RimM